MSRVRALIPVGLASLMLFTACADASGEEPTAPTAEPTEDSDSLSSTLDPCAKPNLTTVEPGALTFVTSAVPAPPYFLTDDPADRLGLEADLAYALAEELGFRPGEVTWEFVATEQILAGEFTDFDVALGGYTASNSTGSPLDITRPYLASDLVLLSDSTSVGDALMGITAEDSPTLDPAQLRWATRGIDPIDLGLMGEGQTVSDTVSFDGADQLVADAPVRRSADVFVIDEWMALWLTDVANEETPVVSGVDAGATEYVLAVVAGNPLLPCVDRALEEMSETGTLTQLRNRWGDPAQWRED